MESHDLLKQLMQEQLAHTITRRESGETFKELQIVKNKLDVLTIQLSRVKFCSKIFHNVILALINKGIRKYNSEEADKLLEKYKENELTDEIDFHNLVEPKE